MTGTAQYRRYVCKLAWRDTRGELAKAIARFAAIAMILGLAIFVGAAATGVDRLFVAAAIPLAALFSFGAKANRYPCAAAPFDAAKDRLVALASHTTGAQMRYNPLPAELQPKDRSVRLVALKTFMRDGNWLTKGDKFQATPKEAIGFINRGTARSSK